VTGRRTYDAAIEVRIRLQELQAERAVARVAGLATNRAYMTDPAHRDGAAPTSPSRRRLAGADTTPPRMSAAVPATARFGGRQGL
jgi:hypothetical protein